MRTLIVALPLLLAPLSASAGDPPAPPSAAPAAKDWHLDLGAGTQFPTSAGAMITAELPYRILAQLDVGWMPQPYAYTIDALLQALGSYDDTTSQLIRAALANSFTMRVAAGWRPFANHGFEITAGYTLTALGGSLGAADLINTALAGRGSTAQIPSESAQGIPLGATLHSLQIQLGWRWLLLSDKLVLRASVSYLQTLASSFSVDLSSRRESSLEEQVSRELTDYLAPYLATYAKTPVIGLSAAYRF